VKTRRLTPVRLRRLPTQEFGQSRGPFKPGRLSSAAEGCCPYLILCALNYQQFTRFNGQPGVSCRFPNAGSNASRAEGVRTQFAELSSGFRRSGLQDSHSIRHSGHRGHTRNSSKHSSRDSFGPVGGLFIPTKLARDADSDDRGVPVSLIGTFAVFPLLGFSINTLSLFVWC